MRFLLGRKGIILAFDQNIEAILIVLFGNRNGNGEGFAGLDRDAILVYFELGNFIGLACCRCIIPAVHVGVAGNGSGVLIDPVGSAHTSEFRSDRRYLCRLCLNLDSCR